MTARKVNAARIAMLWNGCSPAVFAADVGFRRLVDKVSTEHDGRVCLFPMPDGQRFLAIVWRGDRSPTSNSEVDCVAAGGICRSRSRDGAALEAVRMLLRRYPQTPPKSRR